MPIIRPSSPAPAESAKPRKVVPALDPEKYDRVEYRTRNLPRSLHVRAAALAAILDATLEQIVNTGLSIGIAAMEKETERRLRAKGGTP